MGRSVWLDVREVADLASISRQSAHEAVAAGRGGRVWRGALLEVRERKGTRGGRSGTRYEVALRSLPELLQSRWAAKHEAPLPLFASLPASAGQRLVAGQWDRQCALFDIIEPAVRPGLCAADRVAAIKGIVAAGHSRSSVYRWIRTFNAEGLSGLARLQPADKGQRRVVASRAFQAAYLAAGHPIDLLPQLGAFVDRTIKGLWKGKASIAGEGEVRHLASFYLWEECQRLNVPLDQDVCQVSEHRVEEWRLPFETVAKKNLHAKAFADSLPRIARDWTKLDPMAIVIADVKHLDVLVPRNDGSTTYPKLIGFMDGGTGRIFPYLVQCPQRHGITQELVIEAFLAMARDPEWGLPRQLYLDNGSEFGGLDKITPALALLRDDDGREIVRAMPYNASAKPIEPLFRRLDQYVFSSMTGYTGPNRMDKRTQNVGKAPQAYNGSWDSFAEEVTMLISYYHQRRVGGQWKNTSPDEVYRSKLDAWMPIHARPLALEMAFCSATTRMLRKEGVTYKDKRFHHPELLGVPIGTKLDLLLPWIKDQAPIVTIEGRQPFQLIEDMPYAANDTAGALGSSQRKGTYLRSIARLDREVPTLDPADAKRRIVAVKSSAALPTRRPVFLDQGEAAADVARIGMVIEHQPAAELDAAAKRRAAADRRTANLKRAQANARP